MKPRLIFATIIIVLVLCVAGCKPANLGSTISTDIPQGSNSMDNEMSVIPDPTTTNTPVTDEKLTLSEKLSRILADTCVKLASEETVRIGSNGFTRSYLSTRNIPFEEIADEKLNNTVISVSTSGSEEELIYLMLLHTLTTEYNDSVHFVDEEYFEYPYNRPMIKLLFVSDSYLAAGYDTVKDYYLAIREGKCEAPPDALVISFDAECIYEYNKSDADNLWPKLFAAVTKERQ